MSAINDQLQSSCDDYTSGQRTLFDVLGKLLPVVEKLSSMSDAYDARLALLEASLGSGGVGGGATDTADGAPPTPTGMTVTDLGNGTVQLSATDPGQPWTVVNWFRYAAADTADADYTLVGSSAGLTITVPSAASGWYSVGLQNTNSNGTWYSHKSTRVQYTAASAATALLSSDSRVITWLTPDANFGSSPTNGRYQCDQVSNFNSLPTDSPATAGATHSTTGILHPDGAKAGGTADSAYALKRTTKGGKNRFYHRIGNGLKCSGLGDTYRAEIGMPGGSIPRGTEFWAATMMQFAPTMLQSGAPFLSFMDCHHEASGYNGPGPFGIWGDRNGISFYWRLGVGGSWDSSSVNVAHSFVPEVDRAYWWVIHGKQHYASGNGAFLHAYLAIDDGALNQVVARDAPWGIDDSSPGTTYLKTGNYGFVSPLPSMASSANDLFERYGGGLIVFGTGAGPTIDQHSMLATLKARQ